VAALDLPADIPPDMAWREQSIFKADFENIMAQIQHMDAQIAQKEAERSRLQKLILAQKDLIAVQQERVGMRDSLLPSGAGTRSSAIDAQESLRYQTTILVGYEGDLITTGQVLQVLRAERDKLRSGFIADQSAKRTDALKQVDELGQKLIRGEVRWAHMTIRSPSTGFVHGLAIQTPGQVVSAGQEIGRIVPTEGQLEIEVYLPNTDIGFVKEGQSVAIKLDAFPFTRYGVIEGQLVRIGRDAIPEPEARQMETEGVMRSSDGRMPGGGQRVQNLVFPMTIVPTQSFIRVDERDVPLAPGMAVSVEVKTGKRKLIDYFLSPVRADTDSAFRER
jgi:hemolysin D